MRNSITEQIQSSINIKKTLLTDEKLLESIELSINKIIETFNKKGKILIAGNGGSAADAQHMAAELVGRFHIERQGLPAIAITTDSSILTAVANDYGYHYTFARQVEALGNPNDLLVAISTSGNSESIINAIEAAKQKEIFTIGLTGQKPCKMDQICDLAIKVQSSQTPRIQESHLLIEHIICQIVEQKMFGN